MENAAPKLTIEVYRNDAWNYRGETTASLDEVKAALPGYCLQYPHRVLDGGVVVAEAQPKKRGK